MSPCGKFKTWAFTTILRATRPVCWCAGNEEEAAGGSGASHCPPSHRASLPRALLSRGREAVAGASACSRTAGPGRRAHRPAGVGPRSGAPAIVPGSRDRRTCSPHPLTAPFPPPDQHLVRSDPPGRTAPQEPASPGAFISLKSSCVLVPRLTGVFTMAVHSGFLHLLHLV